MNKTALTECNRRWAARVDLQTHIKTNTPIINSELTFFPSDLLEIVAYAIQTNPLDKNGSLGVCNLNLAMHHRVAEIEEVRVDFVIIIIIHYYRHHHCRMTCIAQVP